MKILFFAWLKDEIGTNCYELNLGQPLSIAELKTLLINHMGEKALILKSQNILCAVNLTFESNENVIVNTLDEVAFYPPVTGG